MAKNESTFENTLVIANPGTGKTTELANRVVELLKSGVAEKSILCITFTNKAASEMRSRIDEKIKESKINAKPYLIDVHTFHSYAYEYLGEMGLGYEITSNNMLRYSIFKSFQTDKAFNYSTKYIINDLVPKVENAIRYLKSFGILPEDIPIEKSTNELKSAYENEPLDNITLEELLKFLKYFINAYKNYEKEKNDSEGLIDYNDMLIKFINNHDGKKHYKYVLVDELQDVNELEMQIAVLSGENLFLVGDRKQAIFGFQGGSLKNFENFERMKGINKEKKSLNYRSLQPILDYSRKHFLKYAKDTSYKNELSEFAANRKGGNSEVKVFVAENQVNAALSVLSKLKDKSQKTAMITRTNGQLIQISQLLDKKDIQYNTTAGSSTSEEAKSQIITYLKGFLYSDRTSVINALFTPFSGITLKEAFEAADLWISRKDESNNEMPKAVEFAASSFFSRKKEFTLDKTKSLFNNIIMPISMQIGKEYYITAQAINAGINQFFDTVSDKNRDSFFEYLSILEENYVPVEEERSLLLTTVHKAKGREFDNVIYLPTSRSAKESFIDMIVYSIIKAVKGIDIREELDEEQIRVDFVAFTRAKDNLYIITNQRNDSKYEVEGFEKESLNEEDEIEPEINRFDEAYAMFLNGRHEEAESKINPNDPWLANLIKGYFSNCSNLSYSLLESTDDQYEFLKEKILKMPNPIQFALTMGTRAHEIAERRFKGTLIEEELTGDEKIYLRNIKAVDNEIKEKLRMKQIEAELEIKLSIKDIFKELPEDMRFKAILDAVYESEGEEPKKYLILDWKTDRMNNNASTHRRQLAVYRKVLAASRNIEESDISIAIGFIGLKGNINTKTINYKIDMEQPKPQQIKTFEKHVQRFLNYKKNPETFISELKEKKLSEPLYKRIIALLA
jgi:DNA helicase-2/ATP-dependent DNA helicase PcrA